MGGDGHLDSVIRLRRKIAGGEEHLDSSTILSNIIMEAQFSWNGLHHAVDEFINVHPEIVEELQYLRRE